MCKPLFVFLSKYLKFEMNHGQCLFVHKMESHVDDRSTKYYDDRHKIRLKIDCVKQISTVQINVLPMEFPERERKEYDSVFMTTKQK